MTHGVIGNTSDFGSEESRFEPRWVNKKAAKSGFFVAKSKGQGAQGTALVKLGSKKFMRELHILVY